VPGARRPAARSGERPPEQGKHEKFSWNKVIKSAQEPGWPGKFVKKSTKMLPIPFFVKIRKYFFSIEKVARKFRDTSVFFKKLPKQSPNRRNIAQSGHPVRNHSYDNELPCQRCKNLQYHY
jgi:hypothetical protein